jgi:Domain of unknown function (DUF4424)
MPGSSRLTHRLLAVGLVATTLCVLFGPLAKANDSEAEMAVGGLTLVQSKSISMDSEDLYISAKSVRVTYRFTNTSSAPITTTVAFPLPQLPVEYNDSRPSFPGDFRKILNFKTTIDGKPVALDYVVQAILNGKDVTAILDRFRLYPSVYEGKGRSLQDLTATEKKRLVADGLITVSGYGADDQIEANWDVRATVTRKQVFPAKKTVTVRHTYNPMVGGSVAGGLMKEARGNPAFTETKARYCIDNDWLKSFDNAIAGKSGYAETWIGYVLSSGANWKGPIQDFTLTLDKGSPTALLSVCETGFTKISPTQFQIKRKNFTPKRDLDILIVNFYSLES